MTRKLDRLNETNNKGLAFQALWQRNCETVEANVTDLQTQIDNITALLQAKADAADVNLLTPVEKKRWIKDYADITSEQSDIDAKATTYGITTEKTNYDTAVSALATYLATLTSPVAWNVLTDNTTIVGTTFRSKFSDAETKKQLLLNKLHATAKTLADGAQTQANTATTNAATAQTAATSAQTTATAVKKTDKISGSWTEPGAVLSATDAGTDSTITVAAHTRHWGDGTTTSVNSHTFTAKAYATLYFVYYDDPSQNDTTPSYQITTNGNTAAHNASANRVGLGPVTTPAAGQPDTSGGGTPPGGGYKIFDI